MSKKDLEELTVKQLTEICKQREIPHYHNGKKLKKAELIESILNVEKESKKEEVMEIETKNTNDFEDREKNKISEKEKYFDNLKVGTLIAFRERSGKLNTASVQNVSFKRQRIKLITQYQKEFLINFSDVVWIRTGTRWPRFVMNELKGGIRSVAQK